MSKSGNRAGGRLASVFPCLLGERLNDKKFVNKGNDSDLEHHRSDKGYNEDSLEGEGPHILTPMKLMKELHY